MINQEAKALAEAEARKEGAVQEGAAQAEVVKKVVDYLDDDTIGALQAMVDALGTKPVIAYIRGLGAAGAKAAKAAKAAAAEAATLAPFMARADSILAGAKDAGDITPALLAQFLATQAGVKLGKGSGSKGDARSPNRPGQVFTPEEITLINARKAPGAPGLVANRPYGQTEACRLIGHMFVAPVGKKTNRAGRDQFRKITTIDAWK